MEISYPVRVIAPVEVISMPNVPATSMMQRDAFDRQRISDNFTLGDYKSVYALDPQFLTKTVGGAAVNFITNQCCARLTTSTAINDVAIFQSRMYHPYQPGKSQFIMTSFNLNGAQPNVRKRVGYFDDGDGIFVELTSSGFSINLRSSTTGSPLTTTVNQSDWNLDSLDGTGTSGKTLDLTKTQLMFIDFQWLGVGSVRVGFAIDGEHIVAHRFITNANHLTTVYMSSPSLPVRSEITNTGGLSVPASMDHICSTVISEGGYLEVGTDYSITTAIRSITGGVGNSLPMICLRMKNTHKGRANRFLARLATLEILAIDRNISYRVMTFDGSDHVVGGSWAAISDDSACEYNITATSITGTGIEVATGFAIAGGNGSKTFGSMTTALGSSARRNYIAQNIDSTDSSIYVIYATNLTANATTLAAGIQWREIY